MTAPDGGVLDLLALEEVAWLCTLRKDGSPHQTPVWFLFSRGRFWVATAADSAKARHVRAITTQI